jgi:hypothetical protein
MGGDTDKFTLSGSSFMNYNKLTFKATALEDGDDATYRINGSLLLVASAITLFVFSGVEKASAVVM